MISKLLRNKVKPLAVIALSISLCSCINFEPAVLVPSINFSAEDIELVSSVDSGAVLDFGLETSPNESDSLFNIETLPGVRVRGVTANGAADSAGIQVGDVILAINGTDSNHPDVLTALSMQATDNTEFEFRVRRNTVVFEATVLAHVLSDNSPPQELYRIDPIASRAGYRSEMISLQGRADVIAARVVEIFDDSPLPDAGIAIGDLILAIDGVEVNSAQGLVNRLNQDYALGDRLQLSVYDGSAVTEVEMRLWNPGRRVSQFSLWPFWRYESSLSPSSNRFTILDLFIISAYDYRRAEGERSHSIFGLFKYSSDVGELTESSN